MKTVELGFEMGTGELVEIPIRNMVVTGQTQEAGKTTTLEALIPRAGMTAIAFVTKRGEGALRAGNLLKPYFRERADWRFVAAVLEATMGEKLKFERAWIMRASKGAKTLADVQRNVKQQLKSAKGLSADVYYALNEYLEIVVPRIGSIDFAKDIRPAKFTLNVVDIADRATFPAEIQALVIRSMLEYSHQHFEQCITIMPEAWKFLPQGRGSPVKLAAVELVREGSGLENFVWLDSQDIGGVDKEMLRSCPVWLLGVQREANEIARTLSNIPAGIKKPKPSEIATLDKGEFYACWGKHVVRTYVRPSWMNQSDARQIAMGKLERPDAPARPTDRQPVLSVDPATVFESPEDPVSVEKKLDTLIALMTAQAQARPAQPEPGEHPRARGAPAAAPVASEPKPEHVDQEEALYQRFKRRLTQEAPAIIRLLTHQPDIELKVERQVIQVDQTSARGMIATLISEGFLDQETNGSAVHKEMQRRWNYKSNSIRVYEQLQALNSMGFVTKEPSGAYKAVAGVRERIREI